ITGRAAAEVLPADPRRCGVYASYGAGMACLHNGGQRHDRRRNRRVNELMNRELYMRELDRLLAVVPEHIRAEWLYDYDMHFRMSAERGIPEEQTAMELGDPRLIARELLLGYRVREAESRQNVVSVTRAVLATLGLGFFNLIFVLGPFFAVLGILIAF